MFSYSFWTNKQINYFKLRYFYIRPLFTHYVYNTFFLSLIYLAFKSLLDISQIITQFSQICDCLLSYYRANRLRFFLQPLSSFTELISGWLGSEFRLSGYWFFFCFFLKDWIVHVYVSSSGSFAKVSLYSCSALVLIVLSIRHSEVPEEHVSCWLLIPALFVVFLNEMVIY